MDCSATRLNHVTNYKKWFSNYWRIRIKHNCTLGIMIMIFHVFFYPWFSSVLYTNKYKAPIIFTCHCCVVNNSDIVWNHIFLELYVVCYFLLDFVVMRQILTIRINSWFAPSQWKTALLSNDVSHWLGASLESVLTMNPQVDHMHKYYSTRDKSVFLL